MTQPNHSEPGPVLASRAGTLDGMCGGTIRQNLREHTLAHHQCEECDFPTCNCQTCNQFKNDKTQPNIELWWEDKDTANGDL